MMGFRRSVALPYYPWSPHNKAEIRTFQIPSFLMDGNLFYSPLPVDVAVETIMTQVKVIKQFGGVGIIDWHVRTSVPLNKEYENWGKAYVATLESLAQDSEIWVTSVKDIADWIKVRSAKLGLA